MAVVDVSEVDEEPAGLGSIPTIEPWVESPFFERILAGLGLSPDLEVIARKYHDDGYVVLDEVITDEQADSICEEVAGCFDPPYPPGSDHIRRQDAWTLSPGARALACHESIIDLLTTLYGRPAFPFQTLNFPRGTGQREHSDSIHFSCRPERYMCGVWVALEDVAEDQGPLFYYPGSHKLHQYDYYDLWMTVGQTDYRAYEDFLIELMAAEGIERELLCVPKGSALIWASNLVHGGSPVTREDSTRKSQVTHYYFDGCLYYTPMHSDPITGEYQLCEPIDVRTGEKRWSTWNGLPISVVSVRGNRVRIAVDED
jgi:hypothetical protein